MESGDVVDVVRPPWVLFWLAAAAALGGAVLAPLTNLSAHVVGYLLSSVVCFLFVARFVQVDKRRAAAPVDYRQWGAARTACTVVVVVGFAAACWHVWFIAYEWAGT